MDSLVWAVFSIVYIGMILGRIPGFALDRTGIALLGGIALLIFSRIKAGDLLAAVDEPTIALLFGLMILSAQFRMSGFYSEMVRRVGRIRCSPGMFLALVVGLSGLLSAVLVNDIVCLAMAPMLIEACRDRSLNPRPYLLGLAAASNVGSMATLIGNPQNILIGQVLHLSFWQYTAQAAVPSVLGLIVVWGILLRQVNRPCDAVSAAPPAQIPSFSVWQSAKGLIILAAVIISFIATSWPRDIIALSAAGLVLCSRRMRSREMLGLVDWQLLVLFFGLFVVNYAMQTSGNLRVLMGALSDMGIHLDQPAWLFGAGAVLSNLVSNVPAVMLLLPSATHPVSGPLLAFVSTLSGNLLVVGSIANIIVIDQAAKTGIRISWSEHARAGVPITVVTLLITALWLLAAM